MKQSPELEARRQLMTRCQQQECKAESNGCDGRISAGRCSYGLFCSQTALGEAARSRAR